MTISQRTQANQGRKFVSLALLFVIACSISLLQCNQAVTATSTSNGLPQDVMDVSPLTSTDFAKWFTNGTISANGAVQPANSLAFNPGPPESSNVSFNSSFYKWASQMFLWITSPDSSYGGSGTVMESPVFYTVSPDYALIPHVPGEPLRAVSHIRQFSANQFITGKNGKRLRIQQSQGKRVTVLNDAGKEVVVKSITAATNGTHIFTGADGKEIKHPKPVLADKANSAAAFISGGKRFFLDADGNEVVNTQEGQATGDALISQGGSLVYYIEMVNDMYVEFLKYNKIDTCLFPTTQAQQDSIMKFARYSSHQIPKDSNALAIELKTSWVTSISLGKDSVNYIRIMANIPTYDTTSDTLWSENGSQVVSLSLVGMHIVGSVAGHPEMIWSTFEHQNNTPNAAYPYLAIGDSVKTVSQDAGGSWLFSSNPADPNPNVSHISVLDSFALDTLYANPSFTIRPSNTLRINPFGCFVTLPPNPFDLAASSNSKVIALNDSIYSFLANSGIDVRTNYRLNGATWTDGVSVTGNSYVGIPGVGLAFGTSQLSNSTMETYVSPTNGGFGANMSCFACHNNFDTSTNNTHYPPYPPNSLFPGNISHIYDSIVNALPSQSGSQLLIQQYGLLPNNRKNSIKNKAAKTK